MNAFEQINIGYNSVFKKGQLTIGLVLPIENYPLSSVPSMKDHLERVCLAEQLGFKAIWIRDIPFNVPTFGDVGQLFEPFSYLAYLAGHTSKIALGIASIAIPLHHPAHVAKSAATVDQLSKGRMILGVASGDRPDEYPALGIGFNSREELFREAFTYIRRVSDPYPHLQNHYGELRGHIDLLPKPKGTKIPMLITGSSRQTLEWNANNADGWMSYPKNLYQQKNLINQWRQLIAENQEYDRPFMQPLYVVLQKKDDKRPEPIQLGFRIGANYLVEYLNQLKRIGVNHVALNLRFNELPIEEVLRILAVKVLPHFNSTIEEETTT